MLLVKMKKFGMPEYSYFSNENRVESVDYTLWSFSKSYTNCSSLDWQVVYHGHRHYGRRVTGIGIIFVIVILVVFVISIAIMVVVVAFIYCGIYPAECHRTSSDDCHYYGIWHHLTITGWDQHMFAWFTETCDSRGGHSAL